MSSNLEVEQWTALVDAQAVVVRLLRERFVMEPRHQRGVVHAAKGLVYGIGLPPEERLGLREQVEAAAVLASLPWVFLVRRLRSSPVTDSVVRVVLADEARLQKVLYMVHMDRRIVEEPIEAASELQARCWMVGQLRQQPLGLFFPR